MSFLSNFKDIFIALVLGAVVGFGAGVVVEGQRERAAQVTEHVQARRVDAKEVKSSLNTSAATEAAATEASAQVDAIRAEVNKRVKARAQATAVRQTRPVQKEPSHEPIPASEPSTAPVCVPTDWDLDVGTVRLLNSARTGALADAALGSNAAGQAPSSAADFQ